MDGLERLGSWRRLVVVGLELLLELPRLVRRIGEHDHPFVAAPEDAEHPGPRVIQLPVRTRVVVRSLEVVLHRIAAHVAVRRDRPDDHHEYPRSEHGPRRLRYEPSEEAPVAHAEAANDR